MHISSLVVYDSSLHIIHRQTTCCLFIDEDIWRAERPVTDFMLVCHLMVEIWIIFGCFEFVGIG